MPLFALATSAVGGAPAGADSAIPGASAKGRDIAAAIKRRIVFPVLSLFYGIGLALEIDHAEVKSLAVPGSRLHRVALRAP
jgi:hypothetical protein